MEKGKLQYGAIQYSYLQYSAVLFLCNGTSGYTQVTISLGEWLCVSEGSVECGVWSVECGVWSAQCTVYSVNCTVYSVQCTVYSVHKRIHCAFGRSVQSRANRKYNGKH